MNYADYLKAEGFLEDKPENFLKIAHEDFEKKATWFEGQIQAAEMLFQNLEGSGAEKTALFYLWKRLDLIQSESQFQMLVIHTKLDRIQNRLKKLEQD